MRGLEEGEKRKIARKTESTKKIKKERKETTSGMRERERKKK